MKIYKFQIKDVQCVCMCVCLCIQNDGNRENEFFSSFLLIYLRRGEGGGGEDDDGWLNLRIIIIIIFVTSQISYFFFFFFFKPLNLSKNEKRARASFLECWILLVVSIRTWSILITELLLFIVIICIGATVVSCSTVIFRARF